MGRTEPSTLTATGRGHLLRRLGDLIAENADRLAEIEVKDNGKLIAEMGMQLKYVPQWYYYFAGLADKVEGAVSGIFAATGQTCIAGSRLLVQESIHDAFVEKLTTFAATARMGDPMQSETQVGPVTMQ